MNINLTIGELRKTMAALLVQSRNAGCTSTFRAYKKVKEAIRIYELSHDVSTDKQCK